MRDPRFSVIIPTLNEEKFLPNLLASLVVQTRKPFEVIVADGQSRDKTVAVAKSFRKKLPVRIIECGRANLPMQRNKGAREARGEWLAFIDADSILLPYCLARLSWLTKREGISFVTCWGKPDSEEPKDAISTLVYNLTVEVGQMIRRPLSPGPFTAVAKRAFAAVGGYDETVSFGEDQNLSQRLAEAGVPLAIMRETLFVWSLRRFRAQGLLKPMQAYLASILPVLLLKRSFRSMPGYVMGGQLYARHR